MLTVSVENFGPIREGTVELRPLTVFVGPNNSGKSYMAMLIYAILHTLSSDAMSGAMWLRRPRTLRYLLSSEVEPIDVSERALAVIEEAEGSEEALAWLVDRLTQRRRRPDGPKAVHIDHADLPVPLRQALQITVEDCLGVSGRDT